MLLLVCGTPEHEMISVSGAVLTVCSSSAKSSQATTIARTRRKTSCLAKRCGMLGIADDALSQDAPEAGRA
jgi:ribosome-binding protein aMBF1 (putative translation factor)